MKIKETLGVYTLFPEKSHYSTRIKLNIPVIDLQRIILNLLYKLNGRKVRGNLLSPIETDVEILLEFGVADGLAFEYLDANTLSNLLKATSERNIHVLDFLCIVRYYRRKGDRWAALRFDYFFLRFLFESNELRIQAYHEKGLQRISAHELVKFLVGKIRLGLVN